MVQPSLPSSLLRAPDIAEKMAGFAPITFADRAAVQFKDVGFLRHLWRNFDQVAPGVFRSNHPSLWRLRRFRAMGIKAVLNLRGTLDKVPQRVEAADCADLGLEFASISLQARRPSHRRDLMALFAAFDTLPRPFLMHCKSGADRAGLASALYLLDQDPSDMAAARRALSFRYLHIRSTATGIQDHILDLYAARRAQSPISIRDWIATEYDRDTIAASYAA